MLRKLQVVFLISKYTSNSTYSNYSNINPKITKRKMIILTMIFKIITKKYLDNNKASPKIEVTLNK